MSLRNRQMCGLTRTKSRLNFRSRTIEIEAWPWQLGDGFDAQFPEAVLRSRSLRGLMGFKKMEFKKYERRHKQYAEMRPWAPGDDMTGVSISEYDVGNGSPKAGDMISRSPTNPKDQWLVSASFFAMTYIPEPVA
jgi:hypothetical protein